MSQSNDQVHQSSDQVEDQNSEVSSDSIHQSSQQFQEGQTFSQFIFESDQSSDSIPLTQPFQEGQTFSQYNFESSIDWDDVLSDNASSSEIPSYQRNMPYVTHLQYSTECSRLKSFKEWPISIAQTPDVLCEAGFYYTGRSDCVTCFSCGCSIQSWEPKDIPWEEHVKQSSNCKYLQLVKGSEFVDEVIKKNNNNTEKEEEMKIPNSTSGSKKDDDFSEQNGQKSSTSDVIKTSTDNICIFCLTDPYDTVFLPCGHIMSCGKCSLAVGSTCPMCKKIIKHVHKIFFH